MKKLFVFLLSLTLLNLSFSQSWSANPKIGGSCSKVGSTWRQINLSLVCVKSGKKLVWQKTLVIPKSTSTSSPKPTASPQPVVTPTVTPTVAPVPSPSTPSTPQVIYYTAKDQNTIRTVNEFNGCANPENASFEVQAKVGESWLPVKVLEQGWRVSSDCSAPQLGKKNDLGWAKVHMDPGTFYRFIISGEVNIESRDPQGRGISRTEVIPPLIFNGPISQDPSQTLLTDVSASARAALANPEKAIPSVENSNPVTINFVSGPELAKFIPATTPEKFNFIGPTPIAETAIDRVGGIGLITSDHRMVYQSQAALPPWGAAFTLKTTDTFGRFIVSTSSTGNNGQGAWRLAYKSVDGNWKYQSVSGTLHPNNGVRFYDLVTLGAPGTYRIQLEFQWNTTFYGVGINDDASAITQSLNQPALRVVVVGDSWTWPVITDSVPYMAWDGYPLALSWLSGWNVIAAGVPGQGYLAEAAGETYQQRVIRDIAPQNPDVVLFTGSPNDHCMNCSWTDQQIAEEAGKDVQRLHALYPHALIILCAPFTAGTAGSLAFKQVADELAIPFIDFSTEPLYTQGNNGSNQLLNGHPTKEGGPYLAKELLRRIGLLSK